MRTSGVEVGVVQSALRWDQPRLNVVNLPGQGDKLQKATDFLNMAEGGHVWLPAAGSQPGFPLEDVEAELLRFTGDGKGHDDIWDTAGIAGTVCENKPSGGLAPRWIPG